MASSVQPQELPSFDPSKPSSPISYPITDPETLASRSYFDSFHFPFNVASVPLPRHAVDLPSRRRLLVCHDMQGGYTDDKWVQGGDNPDAYAIWHWYLIDIFVYFSHNLVTLPPPCWTNAAHTHGVKVLGTFITEWDEGRAICDTLFSSKVSSLIYAERLSELADALGFDGWLINMEVNLDLELVDNLRDFVKHLTQTMHSLVPGSLVIWYDSVTKDGELHWQDQLNEKNKLFFDTCDGIFLNYTWKENYPKASADLAGARRFDVYAGIDVFGRNTYGGGQWNTNVSLDVLRRDDVSAALFAPGWVYETKQEPDFWTAQNRWWSLVEKSWGILQSYPKILPFHSNFDQGHGFCFSIFGLQVASFPWNNISCQGFQPLQGSSADTEQTATPVFMNSKDVAFNGGGSITISGSLKRDALFSKKLFHGEVSLANQQMLVSYSARTEGNCALGLSIRFSYESSVTTVFLLPSDTGNFNVDSAIHGKSVFQQVGRAEEDSNGSDWVLYKAFMQKSHCTLTDISLICYLADNPDVLEDVKVEYYHASIGHLSISTSDDNMVLPPADAWEFSFNDVSWSVGCEDTRMVSSKIIWRLKSGYNLSSRKYYVFVKKLSQHCEMDRANSDNSEYLGVAMVEAFYIKNIKLPDGTAMLRFIIQPCGFDGICQKLNQSPTCMLHV